MRPAASKVVQDALRHAAARLPELFAPTSRLLVGYSGGQDSTCLLQALVYLSREHGFWVAAAHVDHALRPTSAADAGRAVDLARAMGAEAHVRRVDVGMYRAGLKRASLQQAARAARYQALAGLAAELRADALVLAHTADDQAETMLLNLLRGAGLAGLAAMRLDDMLTVATLGPALAESADWPTPPPASVRLLRPLLRVERATTLAYCTERRLPIVEDPSNLGRAYTRNRVRHDLLPVLERFNPAVRTVLARAAELAADDLDALEVQAHALHEGLGAPDATSVRFGLGPWRVLPRAMQRRVLRVAVERLLGSLHDVPLGPVEDALDLLQEQHGRAERIYHLPRGVILAMGAESFVLHGPPGAADGDARIRREAERPSV